MSCLLIGAVWRRWVAVSAACLSDPVLSACAQKISRRARSLSEPDLRQHGRGMKSKRSTLGSAAFDFRRPPGPAGSSDGVPRLYTAVLLVGNVVISTVT